MQNYKQFFKGKKVTLMRIGLLGRGVGDAAFLAECGANVLVVDDAPQKQMQPSVDKLKKYKNIKFKFGKYDLKDFRNCDLVLKGAGTPFNSREIAEAKKHKISVEMSATLFAKFANVPIIGVTGTRGKSTVTYLIAHILESVGKKVILGGNIRGVSTLQLLKKTKNADVAVLELDSWQLQGFGDSGISPNISVFTTFYHDHMGYYKNNIKKYFSDKINIFKYQTKDDVLVVGSQALPFIKKSNQKIKSKLIVTPKVLPKGWKFNLPGLHNEYNAMLAVEVARILSISDKKIKRALATFTPISGRLELLGEKKGIKIYNDNSSTTPEATIAAIRAVGDTKKRKVVLILGGDNKFLDMSKLLALIPKYCSKVVLFKERGTDLIRNEAFNFKKKGIEVYEEEGLRDTVNRAFSVAKKGEIILYSPAFSSFGKYFKNEYERGDEFMKLIKAWQKK